MQERKDRAESAAIRNKKKHFHRIAAASVAVMIALAAFATLFAYELPFAYDMTGQKLFTLSEDSLEVISSVTDTVRIGAVYASGSENSMVTSLLNEYAKASALLEVELLDAQNEPALLSSYDLGDAQTVANGTIIVNGNGRVKLINDDDLFSSGTTGNIFTGEREITGAIRYVTTDDLTRVYLTAGHGETSASELTEAVDRLRLNACEVTSLVMLQTGIPEDADVVIIAAPTSDITDEEKALLLAFLEKGGSLLLMADPILNASADPLENFSSITARYGVDIANSYVYEEDASYYLSASNLYLIPRFGAHEITQQIGVQEKLVVLPVVRGLSETDYPKDLVTLDTLMISSPKSWARRDMTLTIEGTADTDVQGPIALGFAASRASDNRQSASSRIVVLGDSSFMVDGNLGAQANADLLINSVNWLAGVRESEIIAGKVVNSDTLMVRGSDFIRLAILCGAAMPLVMFLGAFGIWFLRRNR